MKLPLLPPRGIFAVTSLVFDLELPASVKETLLQVMALAWANPTHETPPLTYYQLASLTGKSTTTLHGHIAVLRNYRAALRLRRAGHGAMVVSLAGWLYTSRPGAVSENQPAAPGSRNPEVLPENQNHQQEEEEGDALYPHPSDDLIPGTVPENGALPVQAKTPADAQALLSPQVSKALLDAGIFSFLFAEVARAGRPDEDLLALLAWCQEDYPERPGGIFVARLRAGALVPDRYYAERCDVCGKLNGHAETCRRRYLNWASGSPS
jgi:hypothetical protein